MQGLKRRVKTLTLSVSLARIVNVRFCVGTRMQVVESLYTWDLAYGFKWVNFHVAFTPLGRHRASQLQNKPSHFSLCSKFSIDISIFAISPFVQGYMLTY